MPAPTQPGEAFAAATATPEMLSRKPSSADLPAFKEKENDWSEETGRVSDSALDKNVFDDRVLAK